MVGVSPLWSDGIVSSGFLRELQDLIGDAYEIDFQTKAIAAP